MPDPSPDLLVGQSEHERRVSAGYRAALRCGIDAINPDDIDTILRWAADAGEKRLTLDQVLPYLKSDDLRDLGPEAMIRRAFEEERAS